CTIAAPDYPLAPDHNYKDSFEMVEALYQQLLDSINSNDLILMGDSAGGGFALALAQKLRNEQGVQPEQIILLSPWLDITLANPDILKIEKDDPYLKKEDLQQAGKLYAGDTSTDDYRLSPVNGSLNDLGKISIFAGSAEILVADARKLKSKAESEGIPISYFEYENMFHAWMFLNLPESNRAKQEIIDLIQSS
ncbi:MAG TPA: alpha/beta hydrolase, partial [Chitinophagaceae bacterium]|nr:alpha/beta hydrolase [Chitinophagaceae bacterium]